MNISIASATPASSRSRRKPSIAMSSLYWDPSVNPHFSESAFPLQLRAMRVWLLCALFVLTGCETTQPVKPPPKEPVTKPTPAGTGGMLRQAAWQDLPQWQEDDAAAAWEPFLISCRALVVQEAWREVCAV